MDASDYEFVRIPEFGMKELLLDTTLQCGKKRTADEGIDNGVEGEKRAKVAGPVKLGREDAAKYWQSLIDAGREQGVRTDETKGEAIFTPPNYLRSLKLKVNLLAGAQPASSIAVDKFKCSHCDKQVLKTNYLRPAKWRYRSSGELFSF